MTVEDRGGAAGGEHRPMDTRPAGSAARDLERYAALFAQRTRVMTSSAMRDLMAITERPEVISLAGGLPDTSTFPAEMLASVMARVAAESSARALQYGPTEGMLAARQGIARVMAAEGLDVDPDDMIVTNGGQQVIDLVCKTLLDPGDVVVAEGPTYPGAVPTLSSYQADVVQIGMDADGMRVDELEETLDRLEREGRRPKFIYTVPTFQNPAGVTLSLPRRRRLVEVAQAREIVVLEDDPYGMLRFEGERLPKLLELDGGQFVIYAGTFSKILSPGIRLGWAIAPRPLLAKLNVGAQAATLCPSSFAQMFVSTYLETGHWEGYVAGLRDLYRSRRDVMLEALAERAAARGAVDAARRRAVRLGDAARVPRHHRPAGPSTRPQRRLRPGPRRLPRRSRRLGDATELLRLERGRHPRGRAPDRRDHPRAGRAVRHADREDRAGAAGRARTAHRPCRRPRAAPAPRRREPAHRE